MRYVQSTLGSGETILLEMRKTRWEYFPWALLLLPIVTIWLRRWSTEYALTSRRLVTKVGLIGRGGDELRLRRVESVQVIQGILPRLFGYGDIVATGQGNQTIRFHNVSNPTRVKAQIDDAIETVERTPLQPAVGAAQ